MAVDTGSMAGEERWKYINGCGGDDLDYDDEYMMVHDDDGDGHGSANGDDNYFFSNPILLCIVVFCERACVLVTPYTHSGSLCGHLIGLLTVCLHGFPHWIISACFRRLIISRGHVVIFTVPHVVKLSELACRLIN